MTLRSDSANGNQVFDRDLVALEFDSAHHQAQHLLLRFMVVYQNDDGLLKRPG
jgi:hypothetical protein